ncbi:MAG: DUF4340 domain-containing protein [Candidatus Omnitrophica bacterium]|nr:DUF4340 domain-containing protein [Candidatus Omnitrophota bacterium]
MNQKQLYILIFLLLVIGGTGLYVYRHKEASWKSAESGAGKKLLGDFPVNDVAQVVIKQPKAELHLVKQNDLWRVQERYDYPANFTEISGFIRKAWELKGVQRVDVGPSQLPRLELVSPDKSTNSQAGTLVELKDKNNKLLGSLLLGKKHMRESSGASPFGDTGGWPDGRYIMVTNGAAKPNVWLVSDPFTSIEPKPDQWLNKDFLKVDKIRSVSVVSTNATNGWTLARETESGAMKLMDKKDGEELDTSKVSGVSSVLSSASFVDVLPPDIKPDATGLDKPIKATLETFDNFDYHLQIGRETNSDNYPVRVTVTADLPKERVAGKDEKPEEKAKLDKEFNDKMAKLTEKLNREKALDKWTFLVSKWTIDPLLKPRSDLLVPPKKEEPKTPVAQPAKKEESPAAKPNTSAAKIAPPPPPALPAPPAASSTSTNEPEASAPSAASTASVSAPATTSTGTSSNAAPKEADQKTSAK